MKVIMYEATFSYVNKTWEKDDLVPRKSVRDYDLLEHTLPSILRTLVKDSDYYNCLFPTKQKAINFVNEHLYRLTKDSYSRGRLRTEDGNIDFDINGLSVYGKVNKKTITIPEENIKEELR